MRGRKVIAAGVLATGLAGAGVAVTAMGGTAASAASTTTTQAAAPSGAPATGSTGAGGGTAATTPRSSTPVRSDEQSVTSAQAATLKAKALAAVPGGTVYRIETDAGDGTYEAHMTKADGTLVTVKFDAGLNVTTVEDGMGTGDPAPAGGQGGTGAPSGSTGSSATTGTTTGSSA